MTKIILDIDLLRTWVLAEIDYALARVERGSDGYLATTRGEQEKATAAFDKLCFIQKNIKPADGDG